MERNLRKPSWVCTLIVQCSLCFALYVALNLGHPQKSVDQKRNGRKSLDFNFISVTGGFRPLEQQIPLLKQVSFLIFFIKICNVFCCVDVDGILVYVSMYGLFGSVIVIFFNLYDGFFLTLCLFSEKTDNIIQNETKIG